MIALEDCIALCGLTEEEVLALAEHEHLPEIVACALGDYLLHQEHGPERVRDMIVDMTCERHRRAATASTCAHCCMCSTISSKPIPMRCRSAIVSNKFPRHKHEHHQC
jgi:hypothetical protein